MVSGVAFDDWLIMKILMLMIMMMVQRKGFLFGKISFLMRIVAVIGNILFSTRVKVLVKKFAKNWKKIRGPNLDIRCCCCLICLFVCWDQKNFSRKDGFFFVFFFGCDYSRKDWRWRRTTTTTTTMVDDG